MAISFTSCTHCNDCDDLLSEIQRRIYSSESGGNKGLLTRWAEQVYGCQTPQNTVLDHVLCRGHRMSGTWEGHNEAMQTQQRRVQEAIDDYDNNDCGDKVEDPDAARRFMRNARRMAYSDSVPVPESGHKGPPMPANPTMPRTWAQWAGDAARSACVGGFTGGGALIGGAGGVIAGGTAGAVVDGAIGAAGGTLVAPGLGTVTGGVAGAGYGAVTGAVVGGAAGGYAGAQVGNDLGEWICR